MKLFILYVLFCLGSKMDKETKTQRMNAIMCYKNYISRLMHEIYILELNVCNQIENAQIRREIYDKKSEKDNLERQIINLSKNLY